jgi:tRNA dimethylallyltransferase
VLPPFHHALVLTGPTGSGKSQLGVEIAEQLGAEIISMDSMALYRSMDIGTAKPSRQERQRIPHHLIDVLDPWESASVAWWLQRAAEYCQEIESRGKRALFVGGTALYLKALLCGLFEGPPADQALRRQLTDEAQRLGNAALHARLAAIDPITAARLHPNDQRRIIRALEVWQLTGRPISSWQTQWQPGPEKASSVRPAGAQETSAVLWLDLPRTELYARIDARVDHMIEAGLVDEVKALRNLPQALSKEASQALGYKEMFEYLDGRASLESTVERIRTRSRNYAKRQITWFRHLPGCLPANRELTFSLWGLKMN